MTHGKSQPSWRCPDTLAVVTINWAIYANGGRPLPGLATSQAQEVIDSGNAGYQYPVAPQGILDGGRSCSQPSAGRYPRQCVDERRILAARPGRLGSHDNRPDGAHRRQRPDDNDPTMWAQRVFATASAPAWVKTILGLRQALVRLIGVKRANPGDVFTVGKVIDGKALIDTDDTHLHFAAGVRPDPEAGLLHVVTAVEFHGRRGRLYFIPVRFLHDQVLRSMMTSAVELECTP